MQRTSVIGRYLRGTIAVLTVTAFLVACNDSGEQDDTSSGASSQTNTEVDADRSSGKQTGDSDVPPSQSGNTPAPTSTPTPSPTPTPTAAEALEALSLELELFAQGFIQPTDMAAPTDDTRRLFVASRVGTIHVIEDGDVRQEPLLDIRERVEHEMVEQGLLSVELHPDFAENGYLYANYISHGDENTIVSRFEMSEDGQRVLPETESVILEVEQPHYSHNGGNLAFGPDGYLYIGLGDGENPGDPHGNAQNPGTLLGSILRIDVDAADPYAVPAHNPFVGDQDARNEVWAYGLRNPWRFSFHRETGDMYMVDVGQWEIEEVNVQPAASTGGENYGWPILEGDECWEAETCETEGITMPVATYRNPDEGCAIIGGYPYYGDESPDLEGVYLFGDWCSGNIRGLVHDGDEWVERILLETDLMVNAFGLDQDGEIYVLDAREGGGIYRVVAD